MSRYRHEQKYLLDAMQAAVLKTRVHYLLPLDIHADGEHGYDIHSLYFDDHGDTCLWENEQGYDRRSKFRIRYYNNETHHLTLEKKSKQSGMTLKEQAPISEAQCRMLMAGQYPEITPELSPELARLLTEMRLRDMIPKVIVSYHRVPYTYQAGNVRVTFDEAICSSNEVREFLSGQWSRRPVLPAGQSLLEVKWDELLPQHIKAQLALDSLQWTAFSKYYICRKFNCHGGLSL